MKFAKILDKDGNEIEYKITQYPAGEVGLLLSPRASYNATKIVANVFSADHLLLLQTMIHNCHLLEEVRIGFLAFQRQDNLKKLDTGLTEVPMAKQVINDIVSINYSKSVKFKLTVLDNHCGTIYNTEPDIEQVINAACEALRISADDVVLVFPDKGAYDRYDTDRPFMYFQKVRDQYGHIVSHQTHSPASYEGKHCIVIDDICDGGATFLSLADKMTGQASLSLYVTHGLFTKGVQELKTKFGLIMYATSPHTPEELDGCVKINFKGIYNA